MSDVLELAWPDLQTRPRNAVNLNAKGIIKLV